MISIIIQSKAPLGLQQIMANELPVFQRLPHSWASLLFCDQKLAHIPAQSACCYLVHPECLCTPSRCLSFRWHTTFHLKCFRDFPNEYLSKHCEHDKVFSEISFFMHARREQTLICSLYSLLKQCSQISMWQESDFLVITYLACKFVCDLLVYTLWVSLICGASNSFI